MPSKPTQDVSTFRKLDTSRKATNLSKKLRFQTSLISFEFILGWFRNQQSYVLNSVSCYYNQHKTIPKSAIKHQICLVLSNPLKWCFSRKLDMPRKAIILSKKFMFQTSLISFELILGWSRNQSSCVLNQLSSKQFQNQL